MADIWTYKFKQLKVRWPELSPNLLKKMRKQIDAAHIKWLESLSPKRLDVIQNPIPVLNEAIRSNKLTIVELENHKDSAIDIERKEGQRAAISFALNSADPQLVLEYCRAQESKRVAQWILINLHRRVVSIDKLDERWSQGPIIFGSPLTDLKSQALGMAKIGHTNDRSVRQAEKKAYEEHDLKFLKKLERFQTSKNKRRASLDHISDIPIFIYANWCGRDGFQKLGSFQPPPLCFFSGKALATYCAISLGLKQDDLRTSHVNIRKYVSRLGLKPVRRPLVSEVVEENDGIYFLK